MLKHVILTGYTPKADRSVTIRLTTTTEATGEEVAELQEKLHTHGIMYFKESDVLTAQEREEIDAVKLDLYDKPKTQSQRLRNVLYKVWELDKKGEWETWYKRETERIIEHYKAKLD